MCDTRKVDNKVKAVLLTIFIAGAVMGTINQFYNADQKIQADMNQSIHNADMGMFYEIQAKEIFRNEINLDYIGYIESRNNPNTKPSSKGARGQYQIMKDTWYECTELMGVNWNFESDARNPVKNRKVADFYINTRIPNLLKCYNIPDSLLARLACYNWGIGNVNGAYKQHKEMWGMEVPKETRNYFKQYEDLQRSKNSN